MLGNLCVKKQGEAGKTIESYPIATTAEFICYGDVPGIAIDGNIIEASALKTEEDIIETVGKFLNLRKVILYNTGIIDINVLRNCSNLQELNISKTSIADINVLNGYLNLQELYTHSTLVTDISVLRNYPNLQNLDIWNTNITDLFPVLHVENIF